MSSQTLTVVRDMSRLPAVAILIADPNIAVATAMAAALCLIGIVFPLLRVRFVRVGHENRNVLDRILARLRRKTLRLWGRD